MGFEPMKEIPNGLAFHRLNHSATLSSEKVTLAGLEPTILQKKMEQQPTTDSTDTWLLLHPQIKNLTGIYSENISNSYLENPTNHSLVV